MDAGPVDFSWLWREAFNLLGRYENAVRQGESLEAAADFARFVIWSRICNILQEHNSPGPLKVDSALLYWKAEELLRSVQEQWQRKGVVPPAHKSQIEAINHKLDLIAGQLARMSPAPAAPAVDAAAPLLVIEGGRK